MPHSSTDNISDLLDQLRGGWKRLRRLQWFIRATAGGVGAIEVSTPDELTASYPDIHDNGVHPHIHALIDCRWLLVSGSMPSGPVKSPQYHRRVVQIQNEVAAQWALCLGVAKAGIYTRRAKPGTVAEVLKYAVSSGAMLDGRVDIRSLIAAMAGRKSVMPFGTVRKMLKVERARKKASKPPTICECGSEQWGIDPYAWRATNTTLGQYLTLPDHAARFIPWGERSTE